MSETPEVEQPRLYSEQFLMTAVPGLLEELWRRDSRRQGDILAALQTLGFTVTDEARAAAARRPAVFRFRLAERADKTFERRVRAAVTKRLGRSTGPEKAWNIGRFRAGVTSSGASVDVRLYPEYAVTELTAAASDWVAGMDAAEWAVRHRFLRDGPARDQAADASLEHFSPRSAEVHLHDDDGPRASLLLPATVRAPGAAAADTDAGFSAVIDHLADALGPATTPGRWERAGRTFSLRASDPTARNAYLSMEFETMADAEGLAAASAAPPEERPAPAAPTPRHSPEHLLRALPALIEDLWTRDSREPDAILDALDEARLAVDDDYRASVQWHPYFRFSLDGPSDGLERQLRAAITKRVGKPSGTDKHWSIGRLSASITVHDDGVELNLDPEYSATELRDAATDWLRGADAAAWAERHHYLDGRPALERTADAAPPFSPSSVSVYLHPPRGPRASFFLAPGVRAPGAMPADDDARFASVVDYLVEALGPEESAGRWVRESRAFSVRRMRSRMRVVEFTTV